MNRDIFTTPDEDGFVVVSARRYEYNAAHQVIRTTHADGTVSETDWICSGPLREVDENGLVTTYEYNSAKQPVRITRQAPALLPEYADGTEAPVPPTIEEYIYNGSGLVLEKKTTIGDTVTVLRYEYDCAGRVTRETDPLGLVTTIAYSDDGLTEIRTLPTGATLVTKVHSDGSLLEESGTGRQARFYTYGITPEGKRVTVRIDTQDGPVVYEKIEDGLGRILREREPGGDGSLVESRFSYNGKGQLARIDKDGRPPLLIEYDALGNVSRKVTSFGDPSSPSPLVDKIEEWSHEHVLISEPWNQQGVRLPFRKTTSRTYSAEGHSLDQVSYEFDYGHLHGGLVSARWSIDKYGHSTLSRKENRQGNILETTMEDHITGEKRTLYLDGLPVRTWNYDDSTEKIRYAFEPEGITVSTTDPRGNTTVVMHNLNGQPVRRLDEEGAATSYLYDSRGLLVSLENPDGSGEQYEYDIRGRKISCHGTAGYPARWEYDNADRMTALHTFRDHSDRIPGDRADGDITRWTYDRKTGLVTRKQFADESANTMSYDALGRVSRIDFAATGRHVEYGYGSHTDSPVSIRYSDGAQNVDFTYNHLGDLVEVSEEAGIRQFSYTPLGDLAEERRDDELNLVLRYSRDDYGRSDGSRLSKEGSVLHEQKTLFNSLGRQDSVILDGSGSVAYEYLPADRSLLKSVSYPNGVVKNMAYEHRRPIIAGVSYRGVRNTAPPSEAWQRDSMRRPVSVYEYRGGREYENFYSYNDRGEVTEARLGLSGREQRDTYAYDDRGNRSIWNSGIDLTLDYEANSLNQYNRIRNGGDEAAFLPQFDADGHQTRIRTAAGDWTVAYNAAGRPVAFASGTGRIECRYDYLGRRTEKSVYENGVLASRLRFTYLGYQLAAEWDMAGGQPVLAKTYHWDPGTEGSLLAMTAWDQGAPERYFYLSSMNNDVSGITDSAGGLVAGYYYDAFGNIRDMTGDGGLVNSFKYSSEYYDEELALVYYNYRYYNPLDGRWISRDPLGEIDSFNLYAFVGNNPVNKLDYLGLLAGPDIANGGPTIPGNQSTNWWDYSDQLSKSLKNVLLGHIIDSCELACAGYQTSQNLGEGTFQSLWDAGLLGFSSLTSGLGLMEAIEGEKVGISDSGELERQEMTTAERWKTGILSGIAVATLGIGIAQLGKGLTSSLKEVANQHQRNKFFNNPYSNRVLNSHIDRPDKLHNFPHVFDEVARKHGVYSEKIGGDGWKASWIKIDGNINKKPVTYEWTFDHRTKTIDHRFARPK